MISFFKKLLFCFVFVAIFSLETTALLAVTNIVGPSKIEAINQVKVDLFQRYCSGPIESCAALTKAQKDELKAEVQWFSTMATARASVTDDPESGTAKEITAFGAQFVADLYTDFLAYLADKKTSIPTEDPEKLGGIIDTSIGIMTANKEAKINVVKLNTGEITVDQFGQDAARTQAKKNAAQGDDPGACNLLRGFDTYKCVQSVFSWISRSIFVTVPIFIFYLCSIFLDFSISFGLETMKTLVNEDIYSLWLFTRNLVLAASLFSFLYFIGMVIVGLGNSIQRAAASVILFALFSGFSFSLSTYLIDASNLVTISLYNSVEPNWVKHSVDEPVLGGRFMTYLGYRGIASAVNSPPGDSLLGKITLSDPLQIIGLNLLVGLSLLYNAYVLLMMALLFAVRDLGLIVGVVFSPLLLVDQAVPKLSDLAKKFRTFFAGQLLLGPVFMFLMYVGLKICDIAVKGINKLPAQVGATVGSPGVVMFQILMITAVFWYTYKTCKSLSGVLGDATLGALGGLAQKAMIATPLGLAGQAGSFIGKNTVGRVARRATQKGGFLDRNQEKFGLKGAFNAMDYAGNRATYDFNNSKVFANAQGVAQKMGMSGPMNDGGFAGKGLSYVDAREAALKQAEKHAKNAEDPEVREKLVNDSLAKFRRGNVLGSATGQKDFEKMQKQARKSSVSGQRTSLTDQVSDINFEDLHGATPEKQKAVLTKLKELHAKAEKGGEDVKKWFDKYLQNKILTETTNAIKDDVNLNPLSSNFNELALQKYQGDLQIMLTAGLGLDEVKEGESEKERKEREAEGEKVIGNMKIKLTREVEQIANEKRRGSERRAARESNGETPQTNTTNTTTPVDIDLGETTTTSSNKKANEGPEVYFDLDLDGDITNSLPTGQFTPPTTGGGVGPETSTQTQNPGSRSPAPQSAQRAPETATA